MLFSGWQELLILTIISIALEAVDNSQGNLYFRLLKSAEVLPPCIAAIQSKESLQ